MTDRLLKGPTEVVKVGQVIEVRVMKIDEKLHRISLSMRVGEKGNGACGTPKK